ncbi:MAG: hypothetical protein JXR10_10340 [Cyclobacteriaceae bacterium]
MSDKNLAHLKSEIQWHAKNGLDFILSASIVWFLIYFIWSQPNSTYNKSVLTFMIGAILLPLAFGLSRLLKTNWKVKNNPLQPLGLWLNFAQLIYFPFLIFVLIRYPDYFIMTYAIITGAHLFPYAWFYDEWGYAVTAITISIGSFLLALNIGVDNMQLVPLFTASALMLFAVWISYGVLKRKGSTSQTIRY